MAADALVRLLVVVVVVGLHVLQNVVPVVVFVVVFLKMIGGDLASVRTLYRLKLSSLKTKMGVQEAHLQWVGLMDFEQNTAVENLVRREKDGMGWEGVGWKKLCERGPKLGL